MIFSYKKKMALIILIAVFFVCLDRFLKFLAIGSFLNQPIKIIGRILKLNFVPNYNIAFSLPLSGLWLNFTIGAIIVLLLFWFINLLKKQNDLQAACLAFLILGVASNLFDRLKYGFVIDYLDLKYFTVFNLADAMIAGGVIFLVWLMTKK